MTVEISDRLDRLESLVERQQERLESQAGTIEQQREALQNLLDEIASRETVPDTGPAIGRRTALKAGGALALLGVGAGTATADPQGQVGTESDPLRALYAAELNGDVLTAATTSGTAVSGETEDDTDVAGVEGVTQSTDSESAGVRGSSSGDNYGVDGRVYDDESALPTLASFESAGVFGRTDAADGWGVAGWSVNDIGAFARTDDVNSAAIFGINSGVGGVGVHSEGVLEVTDHIDVGSVGLSAYLSLNQTIDDDTTTTVLFDETNRDDFGGYDTTTGQYTVQEAGEYHASFTIDWQTNFDDGTHIGYELQINGDFEGGIQADTTAATSGQRVCQSFSRTLFDLNEGDTIEVAVSQDSGGTADVWGSNQETYLTLYKVG